VELEGSRALVLGGTSGIGLAVVEQLAAGRASVVAASRSVANRERAAAALRSRRSLEERVSFAAVDVLDRSALAQLFESSGPFDILVSAATGGERAMGPFLEMDPDGFQGSFRKLWGYLNAVQLGARALSERGAIVLVSGSPARRCRPGMSAISTVGNAVEGFVRAVAPELAPRRINVVSPGIIDTPMFSPQGEARARFLQSATGRQPIPRAGTADEVARAVLFALENDYVTGTTIDVDGGALLG